jgi:hypothetical protein
MRIPKKIKRLSYERATELLSYDSKTGLLYWRVDRLSGNGKIQAKAGDVAGSLHSDGYIFIGIDGVPGYAGHHIAWLLKKKKHPTYEVDHRDGNKANNRWKNLRLATSSQNSMNTKVSVTNKLGIKGVGWHTASNAWRARITINYKTVELGTFDSIEKAQAARRSAEAKLFGKFSRGA